MMLPEKYNKITIQLNQYDAGFFIDLDNKISEVVNVEAFLKDDTFGIKLTNE